MIGSILTFIVEFMRLIHISRLPGIRGGHMSSAELEEELD